MEKRKTKRASLEGKKVIFFEIGMIIVLALLLWAFEYKVYDKSVSGFNDRIVEDLTEEIIPITEQKVKPPPPPPPQKVIQINIVSDDVEIEEDLVVDAEADENTEIEEYIPMEIEIEEEIVEESPIFTVVESMPKYPEGYNALYLYLNSNIKYPEMAKQAGIQGKVYLKFVVEKDGSITDVQLLRGIGGGCDEEAIRVVKSMSKWIPGKQRGKPVRVEFNLPVRFTLQ